SKDKIFDEIAQMNLPLHQEPRTEWSVKGDVFSLKGAKEIMQLGNYLRDKFEKSVREDGAVYFRPIFHPALLGTIMDAVEHATKPQTQTQKAWQQAFAEYGWRR